MASSLCHSFIHSFIPEALSGITGCVRRSCKVESRLFGRDVPLVGAVLRVRTINQFSKDFW